jgi:hypothetical protein
VFDTKSGTTKFEAGTNLTRRGNAGTPLTPLEVENLAKSAATNDVVNYQKDPEGTINKWRQYYQVHGVPSSQKPAASTSPLTPLTSPPPLDGRKIGQSYQTPKGLMTWTANGWIPAGGQ